MRQEIRFLTQAIYTPQLVKYLCERGECLEYKVNNFYLDNSTKQFSQTSSGSPRLRLRIYEAGELFFGNIELKSVVSNQEKYTIKEFWNVTEYLDTITPLIPQLHQRSIVQPSSSSVYNILLPSLSSYSKNKLELGNTSLFSHLSYHRTSCNCGTFRITLDQKFSPCIVDNQDSILEFKGKYSKNIFDTLETICDLRLLNSSKFALLFEAKKDE